MLEKVRILKIGGSVITYKDKYSELNTMSIKNIILEIKRWLEEANDTKLVFISGAGSFGHPLAHKYMLNKESIDNKDSLCFLQTTTNMQRMGNIIANVFQKKGIPLFPIQPSSIFITDKGRIVDCYLKSIIIAIKNNQIPFLWGDSVFDMSHRYRILSGDQISTYLYEKLNASDILFGTNVDGIYTENPFKNKYAKIIPEVNDENYKEVLEYLSHSSYVDVTQGMRGKLEEIYAIKKRPVRCVIYNAGLKNNTYKALRGEKIGTTIFLRGETHG